MHALETSNYLGTMTDSAAEQNKIDAALEGGLNLLNSPAPYASRVAILRPFFAVRDGKVVAVNRDGSVRTRSCPLGSGKDIPVSVADRIRELADFGDRSLGGHAPELPNGGLRWRLFGSQH